MEADMPKTDKTARKQLMALGLNPDAPALTTPDPSTPDPHSMPVSDIVFDSALLDGFPDLTGSNFASASRHVFEQFKSPRSATSTDRNKLLHAEIGKFITRVRRERASGTPHVKEQVKATRKQRDLLALLAEHGITSVDDLQTALSGGDQ